VPEWWNGRRAGLKISRLSPDHNGLREPFAPHTICSGSKRLNRTARTLGTDNTHTERPPKFRAPVRGVSLDGLTCLKVLASYEWRRKRTTRACENVITEEKLLKLSAEFFAGDISAGDGSHEVPNVNVIALFIKFLGDVLFIKSDSSVTFASSDLLLPDWNIRRLARVPNIGANLLSWQNQQLEPSRRCA
jgi:hypothetical protein